MRPASHTHKKHLSLSLESFFLSLFLVLRSSRAFPALARARRQKRGEFYLLAAPQTHTKPFNICARRDPRTHFAAGEAKTDHPQACLAKYKK